MKRYLSIVLSILLAVNIIAAAPISASADVKDTDQPAAVETNDSADIPTIPDTPDKPLSVDEIPASWNGYYDGSLDSEVVRRGVKLIFDNIAKDGSFTGRGVIYGYSGEDESKAVNGSYVFEGNLDLNTGDISLKGTKWINRPSNFSFVQMSGRMSLEKMEIVGITDHGMWYMTPQVNDELNIPSDWVGEYDGHSGDVIVRRNISIFIDTIASNGDVMGTAIISPSEKAEEDYGVNGSYIIGGNLDRETGKMTLQGTSWINYPVGKHVSNFSFAKFDGTMDAAAGKIEGTTEKGIWSMEAVDKENATADSGFKLGKDNNSYVHSAKNGGGFEDMRYTKLSETYFKELTENSSAMEKCVIKRNMYLPWHGSCYGIASTMGLTYEGVISVSQLTAGGAQSYYKVGSPTEDEDFLNMINYYQLSQNLSVGGQKAATASVAYNNTSFSGLTNLSCSYDSLAVTLQAIVRRAMSGHVSLMTFSDYKGTGHAVLICGCSYNKNTDEYVVTIYDENCIGKQWDEGEFLTMNVSSDYSRFTFIDANGNLINNYTYNSLRVLDWSKLAAAPKSSLELSRASDSDNITRIVFSLDQKFTLTASNGRTLAYDGEKFTGDIAVNSIDTLERNGKMYYIIGTNQVSSMTVEFESDNADMEISDADDFYSINGTGIKTAVYTFGEGIELSGSNYQFETFINSKEEVANGEYGLVSVEAKADGTTKITNNGKDIVVTSSSEMTDIKANSYIGTKQYSKDLENGGEFTFPADYTTAVAVILGDLDGDGEITSADALFILRMSVGLEKGDEEKNTAADINADDSIDSSDALEVLRYGVGLSDNEKISKPVE